MGAASAERLARIDVLFKEMCQAPLDMDSFEDRVKLQKLIFVLRNEGMEFDYNFNWYIRGPYSPDLARDGFTLHKELNRSELHYETKEKEIQVLKKLENARELINDSNLAELIASYLFLEPEYKEKTAEELNLRKPRFSLEHIKKTMAKWQQLTRD